MSQYFATVENGKLTVYDYHNKADRIIVKLHGTEGLQQLKAFCHKRNIKKMLCSSSVDFPEDGGVWFDVDVRMFLSQAMTK